jgi:molybdopterin-guanine dinucleotide biosynthesis protein
MNKELTKPDQLLDNFFNSLFDIIDDMYLNCGFKKQEITKILVRDLKMGINESYKTLRKDYPR